MRARTEAMLGYFERHKARPDRSDAMTRAAHTRDTPKGERRRPPRSPQRPLVDPIATMGHPPRPARRRATRSR